MEGGQGDSELDDSQCNSELDTLSVCENFSLSISTILSISMVSTTDTMVIFILKSKFMAKNKARVLVDRHVQKHVSYSTG